MKYKTRDFGEIDLLPDRVLEFVQPILGYEQYTQYTLLYDEEIGTGNRYTYSLEEPGLCFLLADEACCLIITQVSQNNRRNCWEMENVSACQLW